MLIFNYACRQSWRRRRMILNTSEDYTEYLKVTWSRPSKDKPVYLARNVYTHLLPQRRPLEEH